MPQVSEITLSASQLTRRYGTGLAVSAIDVELRRGEVLGLLGPNGAGKSTTLQMLTGNLAPSSGAIKVCGVDLMEQPRQAKTKLGYLPETPPLYREMKVDEYLSFCGRLHGLSGSTLRDALARTKTRCGLADVGARLIAHLSKGYQQRVGIAQAILHGPDVVILDEPTAGLDPNQMREIRGLIRELAQGHSVMLSTHILPEVEAVCDRVQILHQGHIVFGDSIDGLQRSRHPQLLLGFSRPPSLADFMSLTGASAARLREDGLFQVPCPADDPLAQSVMRAATEHDWGLTQMTTERTSLEAVFASLTGGDAREAA